MCQFISANAHALCGKVAPEKETISQAIFGAVFEDAGKGGTGMDQAVALYKRRWPSAESWVAQVRDLLGSRPHHSLRMLEGLILHTEHSR